MNNQGIKRDVLLVLALVILGKMALRYKDKEPVIPTLVQNSVTKSIDLPVDNQSESCVTQASFEQPGQPEAEPIQVAFAFHEIDQNILKQMDITLEHINQALTCVPPASYHTMQLDSFKHRVTQMRKSYQHTSPGVALLGPFASTGLVIKEQKIKNELLVIVNKVGALLHEMAHHEEEFQPLDSVVAALEINHHILNKLNTFKIS